MAVNCDTLVEVPPARFFARMPAAIPFCFTPLTGSIAWAGGTLIVRMRQLRAEPRDMEDLLNGLMLDQYAIVTPSTAYYGNPVLYKYHPAKC